MIFDVRHRTTYHYGAAVTRSDHRLRLQPRWTQHQTVTGFSLDVHPQPGALSAERDYYANPSHLLTIEESHEELVVEAKSRVEVRAAPEPIGFDDWESAVEALRRPKSEEAAEAAEFAFPSYYTEAHDDIEAYARKSFTPGRPIVDAARELTTRIFEEFEYDPSATDAATLGLRAFADKKGVCQDFAHVFLACCRSLRVPARYVSGYLLTRPPEGQVKMIGSDASHAWASVWSPVSGWVDFDPTNDVIPREEHVTTAWGRDFADVSPIQGVVLGGGGSHAIDVAVDVIPVEAGAA